METKNEEHKKNNKIKLKLISIKKPPNINDKKIYKNIILNNNLNKQKSDLLRIKNNKKSIGLINSYLQSLKKNNSSQNYNKINNLPKINNNSLANRNSKNIKSFSPIPVSNSNIFESTSSRSINKSNKIQYLSNINLINTKKSRNNSNLLKSLVSPKYRANFFKTPNSEKKNVTNDEINKSSNINNDKNNSSNEKQNIKKRINKFKPFGFSDFYNISKNSDVSAKNIYKYYILEEIRDNSPEKNLNFTKLILKKYKNQKDKLNELYGINENNIRRLKEIKNNKFIAFKEDFNLKEYQNILCSMIKKTCANESIIVLKKNYEKFNEDLKYYKKNMKYRGRYTKLADKIRKNAPSFLIQRLEQLDEENLISKAKYFNVDISNNQLKQ